MSDTTTKSPDELRAEIEQTRRELGNTAAALAQKADTKLPLVAAGVVAGVFAVGFVLGRLSAR